MKKLMNLKNAYVLSRAEQEAVNGGYPKPGKCNYMGDTGQTCTTHSDCTGPGNPVCHRGCCNILV